MTHPISSAPMLRGLLETTAAILDQRKLGTHAQAIRATIKHMDGQDAAMASMTERYNEELQVLQSQIAMLRGESIMLQSTKSGQLVDASMTGVHELYDEEENSEPGDCSDGNGLD